MCASLRKKENAQINKITEAWDLLSQALQPTFGLGPTHRKMQSYTTVYLQAPYLI